MMKLYLALAAILVAQAFSCYSNVLAFPVRQAVSQSRQQNEKENEWKRIISLSNQAYAEYDRGLDPAKAKEGSRRLFSDAAAKVETYIKKYEPDSTRLSYLQVLLRLAALYQNSDNRNQAIVKFQECQRHKAFNSPDAIVRLAEDGREVTIASYVKAQLYFLTNSPEPSYKEAYEIVRVQGASRQRNLAPQFSIPSRIGQNR